MAQVACKNCRHFREAPYEAAHTGCWHPDHLTVTQKEAFLDQQQQPGNHQRINFEGNCAQYEASRRRQPLWKRLLFTMGS